MIFKDLTLVGTSTAFSSLLYLVISNYLDKYISPITSNAIGLIIDISLDFVFQSYIFLKKLNITNELITKFLLSKFISTSASQILFVIYIKFFRMTNVQNTYIRMIISILIFFTLVFPLSKFYVFDKC